MYIAKNETSHEFEVEQEKIYGKLEGEKGEINYVCSCLLFLLLGSFDSHLTQLPK